MARTPRITAEMLLEAGAAITLEKGADALNVRSVAAKLNCSVQPVFRNFGSMETFRRAVIDGHHRIDNRHHGVILAFQRDRTAHRWHR